MQGSSQDHRSEPAPVPLYSGENRPTSSTSPPPPYEEFSSQTSLEDPDGAYWTKRAAVDAILQEQDLYKLLRASPCARTEEIRRGFLTQSRLCHPDKFPDYPPSTLAFQKVSYAYDTLSKPNSRRLYNLYGRRSVDPTDSLHTPSAAKNPGSSEHGGEETLQGGLCNVLSEFMDGNFAMVSIVTSALNENPEVDLDEDVVETIENLLRRLRSCILSGRKYASIVRTELHRMVEVQGGMRRLPYMDFFGRLRLTLQLARIGLGIPLALDLAIVAGVENEEFHTEFTSSSSDANGLTASVPNDLSSSRTAGSEDVSTSSSAFRAPLHDQAKQPAPQGPIHEAIQHGPWGLLGPTGRNVLSTCVAVLEATEDWLPRRSSCAE